MKARWEKDSKIDQLNKELDDHRNLLAESCGRFSVCMIICTDIFFCIAFIVIEYFSVMKLSEIFQD
jgi:hypothetical protein